MLTEAAPPPARPDGTPMTDAERIRELELRVHDLEQLLESTGRRLIVLEAGLRRAA